MCACCLSPTQGFYPVGVQCSLSSSSQPQLVTDSNGRRIHIVVKPVVTNGQGFCECYMPWLHLRSVAEVAQEIECLFTVTLCPLPFPGPHPVDISTP